MARADARLAGAPQAEDDSREGSEGVVTLPGIGPARSKQFARLGIHSIRDLCFLKPRRVERIGERVEIAAAQELVGRSVSVEGEVSSVQWVRGRGRRSTVKVVLEREGQRVDALFFNQPWARHRFEKGATVALYGQLVQGSKRVALATPRVGTAERPLPAAGTLVPHYPLTEGLGQTFLRKAIGHALERVGDAMPEPLPADVLESMDWPRLPDALRRVHAPSDERETELASQRLSLEPLLSLQARLRAKRGSGTLGRAFPLRMEAADHAGYLRGLPFEPTRGQCAVFEDLRKDLALRIPMRRLVQGDVGSGKTAIGLYACLAAAASDTQAAFLAPTELLAEQHFDGLRERLTSLGIESALLTGSLSNADRKSVLARLADGSVKLVFGTHALFGDEVRFERLGVAVIDEQQRFGVTQRRRLLEKGSDVHLLLMTATPIPRTLALTLYGDLAVSRLEGRPGQSAALKTHWLDPARRGELLGYLGERLSEGERAYWVLPRIESSEVGPGVLERHAELSSTPLGSTGVEIVHGAMSAEERGKRLARFRSGAARLLVSTTVIEVGVDVPDATQMVIEGAERFGLAQLHQLRGRVGRGSLDSHCYLFGQPAARHRLEALCRTSDGFALAEEDLRLRGMGELGGLRQAGVDGSFDPGAGLELLLFARDLLDEHPELIQVYARD